MLLKNIFIIYPAGWGGTFINWAINASDVDTCIDTVKNPINTSDSKKTGGSGTAHLHTKLPTHQGLQQHLAWMLYNKPTDCRVYAVNESWHAIPFLMEFDPNAIFIVIHDSNDQLQNSFGRINGMTKWPTYLDSNLKKQSIDGVSVVHPEFDPYNCSADRKFRNWVVYYGDTEFKEQHPVDYTELNRLIENQIRWYTARNFAQPHEVNENFYITNFDIENRIFEINLKDLFSDKFVIWFDNFIKSSQISTDYNTDIVKTVAIDYLKVQKNLEWFDAIEHWHNTKQVSEYLTSHSIIEAEAIRYIFSLNEEIENNSDWDVMSLEKISDLYWKNS